MRAKRSRGDYNEDEEAIAGSDEVGIVRGLDITCAFVYLEERTCV